MQIELFSDKHKVRTLTGKNVDEIYDLLSQNILYYEYCPPFVTRQAIKEDMRILPSGKTIEDKYYIGFYQEGKLIAVMDLIDGYPEKRIVYIGFFHDRYFSAESGNRDHRLSVQTSLYPGV